MDQDIRVYRNEEVVAEVQESDVPVCLATYKDAR